MDQFSVAASSLACRWAFDVIFSSLPTPGTPSFSTLCKRLKPFGISPQGFTLEAPTSRLGDVILQAALLDNRVTVSIAYDRLELSVSEFYEQDENDIIRIAEESFEVLAVVDAEAKPSRITVNSRNHLSLETGKTDTFLAKHLRPRGADADWHGELLPDGFSYNIGGGGENRGSRITVAKSMLFENALFVDLYCEYPPPGDPSSIATRFRDDYEHVLKRIGLEAMDTGEKKQ